jgi:hypothetical protein
MATEFGKRCRRERERESHARALKIVVNIERPRRVPVLFSAADKWLLKITPYFCGYPLASENNIIFGNKNNIIFSDIN